MKLRNLLFLLCLCSISLSAKDIVKLTIGEKQTVFTSLTDAVSAANNEKSQTIITMLADEEISEESLVFTSSTTLDLNGFSIYSDAVQAVVVDNGGTLTITDNSANHDGQIEQADMEEDVLSYAAYINNGKLILNDGHIVSNGVFHSTAGIGVDKDGLLEINGGSVLASADTLSYGIRVLGGKLNVNGGSIESQLVSKSYLARTYAVIIRNDGVCNMNGGRINVTTTNNWYTYGLYVSQGKAIIDNGCLDVHDALRGYCLYLTSNGYATINGGEFITEHKNGNHYDIYASQSNITLNGGCFAHDGNLLLYAPTKHLAHISKSAKEYSDGCRVALVDNNTITGAAMNLNTETQYPTLEEAIANASAGDTISVIQDYTLTNDITIPEGVVMMVPFNFINTCFTAVPQSYSNYETPVLYRTLTVADGVTITVKGELCTNAFQGSRDGATTDNGAGSVNGRYSQIVLGKNSKINVDGKMYCWGFVSGEGTVTINRDAVLYESLQILDWRGGSRTSKTAGKTFAYHQYYVQNVESEVVFMPGSKETLTTDFIVEHVNSHLDDIPFIGTDKGFFITKENTIITRKYDGTTDRINYSINGDIELGELILTYDGMTYTSASSKCPLTNNMSITVADGTMSLNHNYLMLPGAQLIIAQDAQLNISEGKNLYVFDNEDWGRYSALSYIFPVGYTVANGANNRAVRLGTNKLSFSNAQFSMLTDAVVDIQGEANIYGHIKTSPHGAVITSSNGNGIINYTNNITDVQDSVFMNIEVTFDVEATLFGETGFTQSAATNYPYATTYTFMFADGKWTTSFSDEDVNSDGSVDTQDVLTIYEFMRNGGTTTTEDVNHDSSVDTQDILTIYEYMRSKAKQRK